MDFLTTKEIAEKWGITRRRVDVYLKNGRIEGAIKKGFMWLIPENAKKPTDPRKKSVEK